MRGISWPLTDLRCRKDSHLLLTTLILANMIVNEALPEVANGPLGGGIQAVIVSTALVVMYVSSFSLFPPSLAHLNCLA